MKVTLSSCGNPDFGQDYSKPMPGVPIKHIKVRDLSHASQVCRQYIHQYSFGSGNWNGGLIFNEKNSRRLGRVSYNGVVWHPDDTATVLYDPNHTPPSEPPLYHLLNFFGIRKETIKKNFNNSAVQDEEVGYLLKRPGQMYTLAEIKKLSGYLWTAHDECVVCNKDDYSPLQVKTAEAKINRGGSILVVVKSLCKMENEKLL